MESSFHDDSPDSSESGDPDSNKYSNKFSFAGTFGQELEQPEPDWINICQLQGGANMAGVGEGLQRGSGLNQFSHPKMKPPLILIKLAHQRFGSEDLQQLENGSSFRGAPTTKKSELNLLNFANRESLPDGQGIRPSD